MDSPTRDKVEEVLLQFSGLVYDIELHEDLKFVKTPDSPLIREFLREIRPCAVAFRDLYDKARHGVNIDRPLKINVERAREVREKYLRQAIDATVDELCQVLATQELPEST